MTIAIACDLRTMFGPARDQGMRPTCLAFAASDFHAAIRDGWIPLSCEFAFYHAQRRTGRSPHTGATLTSMLDTLRQDGQPAETDWPYLDSLPSDLTDWVPPNPLNAIYRRKGKRQGNDFDEAIGNLDEGRPVLILMMLSDAFYAPDVSGVIVAPPTEMPDPRRRHAVVGVAHGVINNEPAILIRNSWGDQWGLDGHAWLTKNYLVPRLTRVAILTEDADVFANRSAA